MLKVGICWMDAGPMGMAISDWLVVFITSANDFPSLTGFGAIEFFVGVDFLILRGFLGHPP